MVFVKTMRLKNQGFTLLEVLVALAVLAIALGAVMRAMGGLISTTESSKHRLLASWWLDDRWRDYRARHAWPEVGVQAGDVSYQGIRWHWREDVSGTPNPEFRRVELRFSLADAPEQSMGQLVGYLYREPQE